MMMIIGCQQYFLSGFPTRLVSRFRERAKILSWAGRTAKRPVIPAPKKFKPKCPDILTLKDYHGQFPADFWKYFPVYRPASWDPGSWIDGDKLLDEAREAGVDDLTDAKRARDILVNGADTGVRGRGRDPTAGQNQPSAYEHGHLLSDALGAWVSKGLMAGPYRFDELPWETVKISPMGIQVKPTGAGRLIVDMSFPHSRDKPQVYGSVPLSCNASIEKKDFPAEMSSTKDVVKMLLRHGPGVAFCKQVKS